MSNPTVAIVFKKKAKKTLEGANTKGPSNIKKEEAIPLYVRITVNRKQNYVATKVKVLRSQWDSDAQKVINHPSAKQLNVSIHAVYSQVLQKINKNEMEEVAYSAQSIKSAISGKDQQNIFNFAEKFAAEVKGKREGSTITNYEKHLRKLESFNGSKRLTFEEIDVDYLNRYESYLRGLKVKHHDVEVPMNNNYVHLLLRTIRTFFNAAIKLGVTKAYPFKVYEFPTYKAPIKDYLSLAELKRFEAYIDTTNNKSHKQAGIYFLLGCYTGLRVSDWYRFDMNKQIVENNTRILLRAKKNGEWVGMKISKPLARNLERMKAHPIDIEEQTINEKLKEIADHEKIHKNLSSHAGRRTFAVTLCAELGMSVESCANLMGITIKTCQENYYRVTRDKLDFATDTAWSKLK